jgi:hypothetical protein
LSNFPTMCSKHKSRIRQKQQKKKKKKGLHT